MPLAADETLLDRRHELAQLSIAVERSASGEGLGLLLEGPVEPGIFERDADVI